MTDTDDAADPLDRRSQILQSAGRLFAERGYAETGIDDIGDGAGVTGPAIYRHFGGKQDILNELLVDHMTMVVDQARRITAERPDAEEALDALIDARIELAVGPLGIGSIFQLDEHNCSTKARSRLRSLRRSYEDEWLRVLILLRPNVPLEHLRLAVHATLVLIGYGSMPRLRGDDVAPSAVEEEFLRRQLHRMAHAAILAPIDGGGDDQRPPSGSAKRRSRTS